MTDEIEVPSEASSTIVSVIGCGGVGSRHLQALLKLGRPLRIQASEHDQYAADVARSRAEAVGIPDDVVIEWVNGVEDLSPADVTIVATLASGRARLISHLLQLGDRRFLIEKMACQSVEEFSSLIASLGAEGAKGWVNCPRRYYSFYDQLKKDLSAIQPVTMKVSAGDRGLGCNAIHYIDIFHYLTGRLPTVLHGNLLSHGIKANRRGSHLVEFGGSLTGQTDLGDLLDITFAPAEIGGALVTVSSPIVDAFADEAREFALRFRVSDTVGWVGCDYGHRNVSEATTQIVRDILDTDDCRLATIAESGAMHSLLFDVFNAHLEAVTGVRPALCPIT